MKCIGIRHEDKYEHELRVPLVPTHIRKLISKEKIEVFVQSSPKRIFKDQEFEDAGASVVNSLSHCPIIFGVKEIPIPQLEPNKTYIYFSHVIKGQKYNMPMLRRLMDLNCNLIDYEKVTDEFNKRVIFFGKFAGIAGMINTLWSLGQRLNEMGISNPFETLKQSCKYHSMAEARVAISKVGTEIIKHGLPNEICPLTFGITGYGNVSMGAQEILNLLPVKELLPEELCGLDAPGEYSNNIVYKTVFKEEHMVKRDDSSLPFDLQEYYAHPDRYTSVFDQYLPCFSVLVHGSYWDKQYPRIISRDTIEEMHKKGQKKLLVVGDISCDPEGGVEFTHKGTEIGDPVFVYDPIRREPIMGFKGDGVLVMAVDILPSELPRDASIGFSEALYRFVAPIARADMSASFNELDLPPAIKRAMILYHGHLTPDYTYLQSHIQE